MKTNRRQFVKLASGLLVPATFAGLGGILRAGTAPSLKVAGTARVGSIARPASAGGDTEWITSVTLGTLRNNYTGCVGIKFTVGGTAITVTELARWNTAGNDDTRSVRLFNAACADIGNVSINRSLGTPGTWQWATLASPVNLSASTDYFLGSDEVVIGDSDNWYDADTTCTVTAAATKVAPAYNLTAGCATGGGTGDIYVPVNFKYHNT